MNFRYWLPAAVAFVCQGVGIGLLGVYGFFVEPLAEEFDAKVAVINLGPVLLLIAPAFVGPIVGRFVDTHSIRNILLIGVLVAVSGLVLVTQMPALWMAGACFFIFALGMAMYGPVVLNSLLVKIYRENIARALAIAAMGVSLGSISWPFVTAWLMDHYSWRFTLLTLAMCLGVLLGVSVRLGLPKHVSGDAPADPEPEGSGGGNEFLRERTFWLIGISASVMYNAALLSGICYAPHFKTMGFSNTDVATFLAAGGIAGMTGKLLVATFADSWRHHIKLMAMATAVLMMSGYGILVIADSFLLAVTATAVIGGAGGAFILLHPFINSAYYSAEQMGRVNGAQAPLMLPLGLIAAPTAGYVFDTTGSYVGAFSGVAVVILLAMVLLAMMRKPEFAPSLS